MRPVSVFGSVVAEANHEGTEMERKLNFTLREIETTVKLRAKGLSYNGQHGRERRPAPDRGLLEREYLYRRGLQRRAGPAFDAGAITLKVFGVHQRRGRS